MRNEKTGATSFMLFILGMFSETRIFFIGCIAIAEIVIFAVAPILFVKLYSQLKHDGFMVFCRMLFGLMVALFVSSMVNHSPLPYIIKAYAVIYGILSYFLVFYALLRHNLSGLRWFFIGVFISSMITIFAFNPKAEVSSAGFGYIGSLDVDEVVGGALFWNEKVKYIFQVFVGGFYLRTPLMFSCLMPVVYIIVSVATTVSGRSASAMLLLSGALILVGRKNRFKMRQIGQYFWIYLAVGVVFLFIIKSGYKYAASTGLMGEEALNKYEIQSRRGSDFFTLLSSGRSEFFTAVRAAFDNPIIGYGPHPVDNVGYYQKFLLAHGDVEDVQRYEFRRQVALSLGITEIIIPSHSHIMGAWLRYGIFGLIYYLWILWLIIAHIRKYAAAIPQWYGYFAMAIPAFLWDYLFSPLGWRWTYGLLMACLFFARAVGRGIIVLPYEMEMEARKHER